MVRSAVSNHRDHDRLAAVGLEGGWRQLNLGAVKAEPCGRACGPALTAPFRDARTARAVIERAHPHRDTPKNSAIDYVDDC